MLPFARSGDATRRRITVGNFLDGAPVSTFTNLHTFTPGLTLPATVDAATGIIYKGATRFIHNFADPTSDGKNIFVGTNAGNFTLGPGGGAASLASQNTALGDSALKTLTTGYENVAIGNYALNLNTTGQRNTAVGVSSLASNTIGDHNIAFGQNALLSNTEGVYNTALGIDALHDNTLGSYNIAVGQNALLSNTLADYNVAVGYDALNFNTEGYDNVAVGTLASYNQTTGFYNVAVGYAALDKNTTHVSNVAVGAFAGYTGDTNGNVFLGYRAGFYETVGNKLFIDNASRTDEADGRLKALIYGIFAATVAGQSLTFNAGNMGFFGTAAVAKPTGVAVDAAGIHAALVTLGLIAA